MEPLGYIPRWSMKKGTMRGLGRQPETHKNRPPKGVLGGILCKVFSGSAAILKYRFKFIGGTVHKTRGDSPSTSSFQWPPHRCSLPNTATKIGTILTSPVLGSVMGTFTLV